MAASPAPAERAAGRAGGADPFLAQWLVLAAALLTLALGSAYHLFEEHRESEMREQERLLALSRVIQENFEHNLASISRVLLGLSHKSGGDSEPRKLDARLRTLVEAMPSVRTLIVFDAAGRVRSASRPELLGADYSQRDYFKRARAQPSAETLYISPPFQTVLGVFSLTVARMIAGPRGEFAGLVTATLDPHYFDTLLDSVRSTPGVNASLAHGDGLIFLSAARDKQSILGRDLDQPNSFFRQHRDSGLGASVMAGPVVISGEQRMVAQRTVQPPELGMDKPLLVAISRPLSEIYGPWQRDLQLVLGEGLFVALALSLGLYLYQRRQRQALAERERAAEALRAAHLFNEQIIGGVLGGVTVFDRELRYLVWNPFMERLTGVKAADVMGRHPWELFAFLDEAGIIGKFQLALQGETTGTDVFPFFVPETGRSGWVGNASGPLRDVDGHIVGVISSVSDLSQLRQAEQELRDSEQRLRKLFESSGSAMLLVEPETASIVDANPSAAEFYGYSRAQLIGMPITRIDTLPFEDIVRERERLLAQGRGCYTRINRLASGEVRQVEVYLSQFEQSGKRLLFSIVHDITARQAAQAALLQAKQEADRASADKSRFLAAASHDLRQPMQALGLFTFALQKTTLDAEQRRIAANIALSATTLGELVDSLLDISRLEAKAVRPNCQRVDLFELFRQLDHEFAALALKQGLRFKFWFPAGTPALWTDPLLVRQILRNLVGNALRYTPQGGILVAARRRGDQLLMQVWDSGVGIAAEHLPLIWNEFYQVDNTQRDRNLGMGLGLSIVRRVASLLGYELACRSRPGSGSVFEFELPLAAASAAATEAVEFDSAAPGDEVPAWAPPDSADETSFSGKRIVLLEDDLLVAESLELSLTALGFSVALFSRADAALADARVLGADLYVTDYRLPGAMNGVGFLEAVRQRSGRELAAIIISGDTGAEQLQHIDAKDRRVLYKPVAPADLLAAVRELGAAS